MTRRMENVGFFCKIETYDLRSGDVWETFKWAFLHRMIYVWVYVRRDVRSKGVLRNVCETYGFTYAETYGETYGVYTKIDTSFVRLDVRLGAVIRNHT